MRGLTILLCWFTIVTSASAELIAVSANPRSIEQGRTLTVRALFDAVPTSVICRFLDDDVVFFPLDTLLYRAIIGIPLKTEPGSHELVIYAFEGAKRRERRLVIEVGLAVFQRDSIDLPEPVLNKLTSQNLTKEGNILGPKFKTLTEKKMWKETFLQPAEGPVTTPFGSYRVYDDGGMSWPHKGVDIAAPLGDPARACAGGVIILAQEMTVHGKSIMIDHGHGIVSIYCHLDEILVNRGERVTRGSLIGLVGETGTATGPHLHWGVSVNNVRVDPIQWIRSEIQ